MRLPIPDNAHIAAAAQEPQRLGCWEFNVTLHIYQIRGGTASPFNGLATF
jgi:hypothetical protein